MDADTPTEGRRADARPALREVAWLRLTADLRVDACWGACTAALGRVDLRPGSDLTDVIHSDDHVLLKEWLRDEAADTTTTGASSPLYPVDLWSSHRHLRLRDATGTCRVLVAAIVDERAPQDTAASEEARGRHAVVPRTLTLCLRDARAAPSHLGEVLTPIVIKMMETTDDFIFFKNTHHVLLVASQSMVHLCEPVSHWREFARHTDYDLFPEALADQYFALEQAVYRSGEVARELQPIQHLDGKRGWVDNRKYPIYDDADVLLGLYGIARDVTPQIEAVIAQELTASVFANASDAIVILDPRGVIVNANDALYRTTGLHRGDVIGQHLHSVKHHDEGEAQRAAMFSDLQTRGSWQGEVTTRDARGVAVTEIARFSAVCDDTGKIHHYVGLYSDITELKAHERVLERIAHFDELTGLANRTLLADRLDQALARCARNGTHLAIAYLDLDSFKQINDRHSHHAGDQYLVAVATALRQALRDTDTLARIGGDEFIAVIADLEQQEALEPVVERLLAAAAKPVRVAGVGDELQSSASIGIAVHPRDGQEADQLLRRADQAMYEAKRGGKNRALHFNSAAVTGNATREELQRALRNGELRLAYQPKVNLRAGELQGVEALVRWQHPLRGHLLPAEFLPLVERENLAIDLGNWVLEEAIRQGQAWHDEGLSLSISVNISGVHLLHPNFVHHLSACLRQWSRDGAARLEIEVLESTALNDVAAAAAVIDTCRSLGVDVSLDDFGTGFSSLTHLRQLPVSTVKIDRSFVEGMLDDPEDYSIVSSIVGLCAGMRRTVIAEGVCSAEHARGLLALGCDLGQGFAIARPRSADELPAWVADWYAGKDWLRFRSGSSATSAANNLIRQAFEPGRSGAPGAATRQAGND